MSKRSSKNDPDTVAINKLKKYIASHDPSRIEKRKQYAQNPQVKNRRKELNAERRLMWNVITKLMMDGKCYDESGKQYSIYINRVITDANSTFYSLDDNRNIITSTYLDKMDLISKPYKAPSHNKKDEVYEEYLSKFMEGDPQILEQVSKKRVYTESSDPTIDQIRKILLEQNKESSDEE